MDHIKKKKLARKMRTTKEIRKGTGIFDTKAWNGRREAGMKKNKSKHFEGNMGIGWNKELEKAKRPGLLKRLFNFIKKLFKK